MTCVKICGIRRIEDALVAAEAGADFLGLNFYRGSRRVIEPEVAREIIAGVRREHSVKMVGVFVNDSGERMNEIARVADLDYVQLSGDEPESVPCGMCDNCLADVTGRTQVDVSADARLFLNCILQTRQRFPDASRLVSADTYAEAFASLSVPAAAACVVVTRGHSIVEVPVRTLYPKNGATHFRNVSDTVRIITLVSTCDVIRWNIAGDRPPASRIWIRL